MNDKIKASEEKMKIKMQKENQEENTNKKEGKMKENNFIKPTVLLAVTMILFLLLSFQVLAIGISPGRVTVNFEPYLHKEIELKVINNEHKDMRVMLGVIGELSDYITLKTKSFDFTAAETEKTFTYTVDLPEKLLAGEHEVKIAAAELPPAGAEEGVYIGATIVVTSQLLVKVPYPYKYAQIRLTAEQFDVNKTANFYVEVDNLGEQDLVDMEATIEILTSTNEKIVVLKTDSKTIPAKTKAELKASWTANVNPGNYRAIATLAYDEGKLATAEKVFAVGSLLVDVVDISVKSFTLGEIAKFDITVENKWSEAVSNVYAQLQIEDVNKNLIANAKTPSIDLPALSRNVLNAYWDTAGVREGTYSGRLMLNFANQVLERQLKTEIKLDSIKVEIIGVGITARAAAVGAGRQNLMFILVVAIILLIVINITWFVYFKRREKKR